MKYGLIALASILLVACSYVDLSVKSSPSQTTTSPVLSSASLSTVASSLGSLVADGSASVQVTVTVKDVDGNLLAGRVVGLSSSRVSDVITNVSATTDSLGVATFTAKSTVAGNSTYTGTISSDSVSITQVAIVTFAPGDASASLSTVSASSTSGVTSNKDISTITVTLKDANLNAISGKTISLTSSRGASDTITTQSAVTSSTGQATFKVKSLVVGAGTFTATDTTDSIGITPTVTVTFTAVPTVDLEVPIELSQMFLGSDTSTRFAAKSATNLTTTDYDGTVTYSFEIIATNIDSSNRNVYLHDGTSNVATIAIPASTTVPTRSSTSFTPGSVSATYQLSFEQTSATADVSVFSSKMIVKQVGATKTKIFIPLVQYETTDAVVTYGSAGYLGSVASATFNTIGNTKTSIWKKDSSAWETLASSNPYTLEVILGNGSALSTATASLFNKTTGNQVTSSQIAYAVPTGHTAYLRTVSFADSATDFTDGSEFELRVKRNSVSGLIYKAGLWVKLNQLIRGEVVYKVAQGTTAATPAFEYNRARIPVSSFTSPLVFLESVGFTCASGCSSEATLVDYGTSDSGTLSGTAVTGATQSLADLAARSRIRSSAITLTSGNRYMGQLTNTSGALSFGSSSVIVQFGH